MDTKTRLLTPLPVVTLEQLVPADHCYRRLARDLECLSAVLTGPHFLVFACLMLHQVIHMYSSS